MNRIRFSKQFVGQSALAFALLLSCSAGYGQDGQNNDRINNQSSRQTSSQNNSRNNPQSGELTIEQCYVLARQNYPQIKQRELIIRTREYSIENVSKGYLPQVSFSGQATYQTQTIAFPFNFPGVQFPAFSKDQYKILAEVDQTIYDGGTFKHEKETKIADQNIQLQNLEVDLYTLKDRINQLFFGVLLIDKQLLQNELRRSDLRSGLEKTESAIANGTAFRSSADELKAEIFKSDQQKTELLASRKAYRKMLSLFINQPLDEQTVLVTPSPVSKQLTSSMDIKRPELALFDYRKKMFDIQEEQIRTNHLPKISAFIQGAYGRPTLNFISNEFGFWALGGIRLSWSLSGFYTNKNDKRLLTLNRNNLDIQKETFLFNTNLTLTLQKEEISKYQELIDQDQEIISLRTSVKTASNAQLQNGVLTSHDYITQVNAESQARESLILHQVQLLQSQYNTKTTSGN